MTLKELIDSGQVEEKDIDYMLSLFFDEGIFEEVFDDLWNDVFEGGTFEKHDESEAFINEFKKYLLKCRIVSYE